MGIFTFKGSFIPNTQDISKIIKHGIFRDQRVYIEIKEISNQSSNRIRRNRLQLLDMMQ